MYMAPEFFVGENPKYTRTVDIFAMGMLFLTMLQAEPGQPLVSPRTGCHENFLQSTTIHDRANYFI